LRGKAPQSFVDRRRQHERPPVEGPRRGVQSTLYQPERRPSDATTGTPLGTDTATPVSDDYGPRESAFTGRIHWVQIDLGKDADDNDHLITPEERYRIAMTRQ
jgi:arylsulfatase